MRRYIINNDLTNTIHMESDVIIVGSGAAGLYAALHLDKDLSCVIINKSGSEESNSMYAQGGIAAVIDQHDTTESHLHDTLNAGAGLCDADAVRVLVSEGPQDIKTLLQLGVPFDKDSEGKLKLTREGAHECNRIVHSGGDATGLHLTESLTKCVAARSNLHILNAFVLMDIVTDENGETAGALAIDSDKKICFISSSHVILASGGIGHVYRNSTNARCATGDGIAAAMRAGAAVKDMEFVQFHPTALIHPDKNGRFFLISEALRGEGAILRNRRSERFMEGVHPMADLAPRDIVSRAIIAEMKKYDLPNVYLDITVRPRAFLQERFPTIYEECMSRDLDIAMHWIPVVPVQHYFMGGIKTDLNGQTNIGGLYACGESACTGVHGANRLASNSLLECLVFARRCAQHINGTIMPSAIIVQRGISTQEYHERLDIDSIRTQIRNTMTKNGGIIRNKEGMTEAIAQIEGYFGLLETASLCTVREIETFNMATVGLAILKAALQREKSVGAHFRSDDVK